MNATRQTTERRGKITRHLSKVKIATVRGVETMTALVYSRTPERKTEQYAVSIAKGGTIHDSLCECEASKRGLLCWHRDKLYTYAKRHGFCPSTATFATQLSDDEIFARFAR